MKKYETLVSKLIEGDATVMKEMCDYLKKISDQQGAVDKVYLTLIHALDQNEDLAGHVLFCMGMLIEDKLMSSRRIERQMGMLESKLDPGDKKGMTDTEIPDLVGFLDNIDLLPVLNDASDDEDDDDYLEKSISLYQQAMKQYKNRDAMSRLEEIGLRDAQKIDSRMLSDSVGQTHHALDAKPATITKEEYAHAATEGKGRYHFFRAEIPKDSLLCDLEKGDLLKTKILSRLKTLIEAMDVTKLEAYKKSYRTSDEYKILSLGQGITTRLLGLKTDSVKALEKMITAAEARVSESKDSPKPS